MRNSKELKVKYHGNKEKPSRVKNPNVASMSKLGYRDDSPYNTLPYIDIHTPSGRIDMSGTGIPLWANGRILPPYSGVHQFDTTQVKEIPLAQDGQEVYNMERAKQLYTPDETGHWPSVDYETGEWLKSKEHPTAWMEYLYGYTLNPQQALNYDVRTNPQGYFGENTLQYVPKEKEGGSKLPPHLPEAYKTGGSWLEQYQGNKSIVDTVRAKYASRPSSAPQEKQPEKILNVPKTLTAQTSTTDTGINKKNIETQLDFNNRYISPSNYGEGEIFTEDYIKKLKKDYNVDLEYDPADPFIRIAGLFGAAPEAYYNPFTRTVNYATDFGYSVEPKHPYVQHDILMHEIPHAIQFDRHKSVIGKLGEAGHMLSGLLMGQNERYNTPGTFEYEAHNPIEEKLRDDFDKAWDERVEKGTRRKGGSWLNQYE